MLFAIESRLGKKSRDVYKCERERASEVPFECQRRRRIACTTRALPGGALRVPWQSLRLEEWVTWTFGGGRGRVREEHETLSLALHLLTFKKRDSRLPYLLSLPSAIDRRQHTKRPSKDNGTLLSFFLPLTPFDNRHTRHQTTDLNNNNNNNTSTHTNGHPCQQIRQLGLHGFIRRRRQPRPEHGRMGCCLPVRPPRLRHPHGRQRKFVWTVPLLYQRDILLVEQLSDAALFS